MLGSLAKSRGQRDMGTLHKLSDYRSSLKKSPNQSDTATAWSLYHQASAIDETDRVGAMKLYEEAIRLDPYLDIAYTNLGNCYFNVHDVTAAKKLYERALQVNPHQPEALYNLGFMLLGDGDAEKSIDFFTRSLTEDPKFSDAHFNIAMAYEQLGRQGLAKQHWKAYVALEPKGMWSEIAWRHLRE